ncbi:Sil1 [Phodopus roborovskii]|uniref:Sil1 protein n=1 Tax=Phodopus roborovskii TaxID=109678 RepID=A0AAV0A1S4_PHORO|nr:Sil1 [Phodopus roborovskii]
MVEQQCESHEFALGCAVRTFFFFFLFPESKEKSFLKKYSFCVQGKEMQKCLVLKKNKGDELHSLLAFWGILGQAVPAGSHVRMNLQTGAREVKLQEDKFQTNLKGFKKGKRQATVKQLFRPIEELKKEFDELNVVLETDMQIMVRLINKFNSSSSSLEEKVAALFDLEYYVHQMFAEEEAELTQDSSPEKLQQYRQVHLLPGLREQGWCEITAHLLALPEHDAREKVLQTLGALLATCRDRYRQDLQLSRTLGSLQAEYQTLASLELQEGEDEGYFRELLASINSLLKELR